MAKLTDAQQAELNRRGSLVELDLSGSQRFMAYHDPRTGQEFSRLPADEYSLTNYMMRGLRPGRAPDELKRLWEADRPAREAAAQRQNEALRRSPHGQAVERELPTPGEDEIQERVTRAVREALAAAGVIPASQVTAAAPPVQEQVQQGPTQLRLL